MPEEPMEWEDWVKELHQLQAEQAVKYAGHAFDEDGWHYEEECRTCLEAKAVTCECRCGTCCRRLLIEADLEDAKREPKIAELGSPIYDPPEITGGEKELIGYYLNRIFKDKRGEMACVFLNEETNLCSIYETRPLGCRLFDCAGEGREQLIELGIIDRDE